MKWCLWILSFVISAQALCDEPDGPTSIPDDPAVLSLSRFILDREIETHGPDWKTRLPAPPRVEFTPEVDYFWTLDTSRGRIRFRLRPDAAPVHVASTIYLTLLGFYDRLSLHRVIPGFVVQGGCPIGDGKGGPGYKLTAELDRGLLHDRRGLLSSANAGPGTDGSQFFITLGEASHLDGRHTIFGEMVDGAETLREMEMQGTPGKGIPKQRLLIRKASLSVELPPPPADPIETIDEFLQTLDIYRSSNKWRRRLPEPPEVTFPKGLRCVWQLTTSEGPIEIVLMPHLAPKQVVSIIYLSRVGFYDGLTFHRVIPGFIAQGGCPIGDGRGDPGYGFDSVFDPAVRHDRAGRVSMVSRGPGTDGSQFFITFAAAPHLDGKHTVFGQVITGMTTVRQLEQSGSRRGATRRNLRIEKAIVVVEQIGMIRE